MKTSTLSPSQFDTDISTPIFAEYANVIEMGQYEHKTVQLKCFSPSISDITWFCWIPGFKFKRYCWCYGDESETSETDEEFGSLVRFLCCCKGLKCVGETGTLWLVCVCACVHVCVCASLCALVCVCSGAELNGGRAHSLHGGVESCTEF